ncbi:hypothetical protein MMC13_006814 [Lambiella insularis]|nr:hypothetical protein [Lambiella insularis]
MTAATSHPEKVWYHANCHCGGVKYTVLLPRLEDSEINNGYIDLYPHRHDVVFHQGFHSLTEYRFGNKDKFCPTCGSSIMIDFNGSEMESFGDAVAINIRMIKDIDLNRFKMGHFDGKNRMGSEYRVE